MSDISKAERDALGRIDALDDPDKLRNYIGNARRQGSAVVERAAFARLCRIQPAAQPGTFEHDVWQSVHATEELLRQDRGKTVRLTRTRQKLRKDGAAKTVADLTIKPTPSEGFHLLVDMGHPEFLFEAVVLRHQDIFDSKVRDAAEMRLIEVGLEAEDLTRPAPAPPNEPEPKEEPT